MVQTPWMLFSALDWFAFLRPSSKSILRIAWIIRPASNSEYIWQCLFNTICLFAKWKTTTQANMQDALLGKWLRGQTPENPPMYYEWVCSTMNPCFCTSSPPPPSTSSTHTFQKHCGEEFLLLHLSFLGIEHIIYLTILVCNMWQFL